MNTNLRILIAKALRQLLALLKDRCGNFGILTTFLLLPLLAIAGLCVDLTQTLNHREALQQIADSAALDAVSPENAGKYALLNADISALNSQTTAKAEGIFRTALRGMGLPEVGTTIHISTSVSYGILTVNLQYSYDFPTAVMNIVGIDSLTISGSSSGKSSDLRYKEFHIFLDNSPSMGIANNEVTMERMGHFNWGDKHIENCVFACHTDNWSQNTWQVAKNHNIRLRIDDVRSSMQVFINALEARRKTIDQYKVALYSYGVFSDDLVLRPVTQLVKPTNNMDVVRSIVGNIDILHVTNDYVPGARMTDFPVTLAALGAIIPNSGNGSTPSKADQVLVVVSDGLSNRDPVNKECKGTVFFVGGIWHCYEPIDLDQCTAIKKRGIKIATLYTTYVPLSSSIEYEMWIRPFERDIPVAMKSCASDGLAFVVGLNDSMEDVMSTLFAKVTATSSRLTD